MLIQHGIKVWLAYDDRRRGALEHKEGTINNSSNTISCDVLIEEEKVSTTCHRVFTFILTTVFGQFYVLHWSGIDRVDPISAWLEVYVAGNDDRAAASWLDKTDERTQIGSSLRCMDEAFDAGLVTPRAGPGGKCSSLC